MDSRNLCRIPFQPFFVERVFHIFDKDDNGSISLQEFIDAMHQFAGQSPDDKIKFLFKVYDIDGKKERQTARFAAAAAAVKTSSIVRPVPRPQIGPIYPRPPKSESSLASWAVKLCFWTCRGARNHG